MVRVDFLIHIRGLDCLTGRCPLQRTLFISSGRGLGSMAGKLQTFFVDVYSKFDLL